MKVFAFFIIIVGVVIGGIFLSRSPQSVESPVSVITVPKDVESPLAQTDSAVVEKGVTPSTVILESVVLPSPIPTPSPVAVSKVHSIFPSVVVKPEPSVTPEPKVPTASPKPFSLKPEWQKAVVNLVCTNRYGEVTNALNGSGVLIDERGIILTNAHVAIEFLFAEWPTPSLNECMVRTGSPAEPLYRARLLYIPEWYVLRQIQSLYTPDDLNIYGKKDYALLYITGRTNPEASLPNTFQVLPLSDVAETPVGTPTFLIGYPASFLGGISMLRDLYQISSPATVSRSSAIENNSVQDVIAFEGILAGQHGSSGGAIVGRPGELIGMVTFFDKGFGYSTSERIINAITIDYVSRDLKSDTGLTLKEFVGKGEFSARSLEFMSTKGVEYQKSYAKAWKTNQDIIIPGTY